LTQKNAPAAAPVLKFVPLRQSVAKRKKLIQSIATNAPVAALVSKAANLNQLL